MYRILAISVFLLSLSCMNAQSLNDSLLLYYPFHGNGLDQSGNSYHGIVNASLSQDRLGNPNSAYSFNGLDEYINLPNSMTLKPDLPVTVSLWANFNNFDPSQSILFSSCYAQDNHAGVWVYTTQDGKLTAGYGTANGIGTNNRSNKIGTTTLQLNQWYQITAVISGPGDMELYLNCVNDQGTYTGSATGQVGYTIDQGSIGRKGDVSPETYNFDGSLDEVRYWNRALTPAEIQGLCSSVAIKELSKPTFEIYPNPTNQRVVHTNSNITFDQIILYDALGSKVSTCDMLDNTINLGDVNPGIYFLEFQSQETRSVQKIMLE